MVLRMRIIIGEALMKKLVVTMTAVLLFCFTAAAYADDFTPAITVKGEGSIVVEPDLAAVTFAVTAEKEDASAAQQEVTEKANNVKNALLEAGFPEEQFKTQAVELYTNYDYSGDYARAAGYRASISMSLKEIPINDVGSVLGLCSENGVNEIDGVSVYYSRYDEAYLEALVKAMKQAKQKAEGIASAEGAVLSGQFSVVEGYQDTSMRSRAKAYSTDMVSANGMEEAVLDYSGGTTEISAVVTVDYTIKGISENRPLD